MVFNIKDKVNGSKKGAQEVTTMKDPITQKLLTKKKDIREASLDYCVQLLTNRNPKPGFEEDVQVKDIIHEIRMKEEIVGDVEYTEELSEKSLEELKKNKDKYAFILRGGESLKKSLFNLFSLIWSTEEKPEQWRKTEIIQLYKGKGERNEFGNQRNIHTKSDIPKFFGHSVMYLAKEHMLNNMSKFQIGTKRGHRAQEHLFTLKSIISLYLSHDLPVLVQLYDISKLFDRESLRDGMNSIYNCGIQGKLYRLIYNMNKDTKITVRTAVGVTEEKETGENIGQGTLEGAIISAANIDYSVNRFFSESKDELSYGRTKLQPLIFQDDISRMSTDVWSAQSGNNRLEAAMETKLLDFNLDKSCFLVMGSKGNVNKMENDLEVTPLTLCGQLMNRMKKEKYLGDMISEGGLAASVDATVTKRKGQVISNILETKAVIEDYRSKVVGGINAGLEIWELAILPYLINNSETWVEISKKTVQDLEEMQYMFFRYLLATPRTCPIPALLWETGGVMMEHRINKKKLMFYHHLVNLPEDTLASEIAKTQETLSYPGLVRECKTLIEEYDLPPISNMSKLEWKRIVNKTIKNRNRIDILEKTKPPAYKKLDYDSLVEEEFGLKEYFTKLNLPDARIKFALRTKITRTVQTNYKGDKKFAANKWMCRDCQTEDTQDHIVRCPTYQHLRKDKNLSDDKDLVNYFRKVIDIREKLDEKRNNV